LLILAAEAISQSSSVAHAQAPDSKPKPIGSISGRVTIGDKAASGAMVAAFADSPNHRPVAQVPSDSEGHYVLSGLAPGQYNVTVMLPGFVGSGNSFYGSGKAVALSLNEAADSVDFRLVRGGVITGRITDADHKPVMEERVNLMAIDENGNVKKSARTAPL
jgi:hypothetical protein